MFDRSKLIYHTYYTDNVRRDLMWILILIAALFLGFGPAIGFLALGFIVLYWIANN